MPTTVKMQGRTTSPSVGNVVSCPQQIAKHVRCSVARGSSGLQVARVPLPASQLSGGHAPGRLVLGLHRHSNEDRNVAARSNAEGIEGIGSTYNLTANKALQINLNPLWYGVLAEIGAGQEVARWFFRVGGAAGTVAKSVSAYDMTMSDVVYGACNRYVARERLQAMLDYEYLQLNLTLRNARGDNTAFFAFADTVVAKAFRRQNECHGWLGIKFQRKAREEPSQIVLHCRMLDSTATAQQEALGILGVNLIHAAFTAKDSYDVIQVLLDDLSRARVEVDLVDFSGPLYKGNDNRCNALRLVQRGLCDAALFNPSGALQIPHEALYKKNVLVARGRFRPFTNLHNDMLIGAASQFFCEPSDSGAGAEKSECVFRSDTLVILEMTTRDMMEGGDLLDWTSDRGINEEAFLQRVEALSSMGYSVMVSNFRRYFKLAAYLSTFTKESIVIAMGIPSLRALFNEKYYNDLDGGILEGFGRLLKFDLKIYVYPTIGPKTGEIITADNLEVDPSVQKLYDYILQRGTIIGITDYDQELLMFGDTSKAVADSIRSGTSDWEHLVPDTVCQQIKALQLLGYRPKPPQLPGQNGASNKQNGSGAAVQAEPHSASSFVQQHPTAIK